MPTIRDLSELGFIRNSIVETIVSTFDATHHPHAAPMGLYTADMRSIVLKPFKTSATYSNLVKWRSGVANITSNPVLFYLTAFKDKNPVGEVSEDWFTRADRVDAPRLKNVDAYVEFNVADIEDAGDQVKMLCRVEKTRVNREVTPQAYSRAVSAVIESVIHATRIEIYLSSGAAGKAEELIGLVEHYRMIVERVAPDSPYSEIMADIQRRIGGWVRSG